MNAPDERNSELLWRHVVDLRNQEAFDDGIPTSSDAGQQREAKEILQLAADLPDVLEGIRPRGTADARARLESLISRDISARARRRWWRGGGFSLSDRGRQHAIGLALAIGLLLIAVVAWTLVVRSSLDSCGTAAPSTPASTGPMRRLPAPAAQPRASIDSTCPGVQPNAAGIARG